MEYTVTAGYVTATTAVPGGRASIDIPRGAALPADVPAEEVEALLRQGLIQSAEPPGQLSKQELLELADAEGVEVDKRWSAKRIAAALDDRT